MEKIKTEMPDIEQENAKRLAELFPSVVTEVVDTDGSVHAAIDADALRDLVGEVVEGQRERYQFTWPGKREAKAEAYRPVNLTMRPEPGRSVDWDTTQNLYIEGDNLDALKLLHSTYAGKVKLIYIDPPYNTGHDFVYDDDFARTRADYDAESGDYDEEGGRLVENTTSNGRFHSDWCSMIYPRLLLARNLLTDDGVIFISIDDGELTNLRKISDEIFGANNHLVNFVWASKGSGAYDTSQYKTEHEYVIAYAKDAPRFTAKRMPYETGKDKTYSLIDDRFDVAGKYKRQAMAMGTLTYSPSLDYPVTCPDGSQIYPGGHYGPPHAWRYSKSKLEKALNDGFAEIVKTRNGWSVFSKQYERMDSNGNPIVRDKPYSSLDLSALNRNGTELVKKLFGSKVFSYPKPVDVPLFLLHAVPLADDFVLDFFSGSATTADAVMRLNTEDSGNRKFIMVQLPEVCAEDSAAAKSGYHTICDIGEERIRRAGAKIKAEVEEANRQLKIGEEPKLVPDIGFRVLRIGSSNFEDTYATPDTYIQDKLAFFCDNLKSDRSDLDLLFQVLPAFRIPYSAKIEQIEVVGKQAYDVNDGQLIACFDVDVSTECIEAIARMRPLYAVLRDASLVDDATAANFEELFKTFSPDTVRRVI